MLLHPATALLLEIELPTSGPKTCDVMWDLIHPLIQSR